MLTKRMNPPYTGFWQSLIRGISSIAAMLRVNQYQLSQVHRALRAGMPTSKNPKIPSHFWNFTLQVNFGSIYDL